MSEYENYWIKRCELLEEKIKSLCWRIDNEKECSAKEHIELRARADKAEAENKELRRHIGTLPTNQLLADMQKQMGELKFHYAMRGEKLEQLEQQLYNVTTPTRCKEAEIIDGKCRGYQKSRFDDEPSEACKECKKFELFEAEDAE